MQSAEPATNQKSFTQVDAADILLQLGNAMPHLQQTTQDLLTSSLIHTAAQSSITSGSILESVSAPKRRKLESVLDFDATAAELLAEFGLNSYDPSLHIPSPPAIRTPDSETIHELQCRATSLVAQLRMLYQLRGLLMSVGQSPLFPSAPVQTKTASRPSNDHIRTK